MEMFKDTAFKKFRERGFGKADFFKSGFTNGFLLNFLPEQIMPEHFHPQSQLFFHVLEGKGIFISDGKRFEIKKGDIIHVLGTEKIGFINLSEETSIYVIRCLIGE